MSIRCGFDGVGVGIVGAGVGVGVGVGVGGMSIGGAGGKIENLVF